MKGKVIAAENAQRRQNDAKFSIFAFLGSYTVNSSVLPLSPLCAFSFYSAACVIFFFAYVGLQANSLREIS